MNMTVFPSGAHAFEISENRKMAPSAKMVATTGASQATCPKGCPWRGHGCYAETHWMGRVVTSRLNASLEEDPVKIALAESAEIDGLLADKPLRIHTVGDCPNRTSARIIGEAASRYAQRSEANGKRQRIWGYTHARQVKRADFGPDFSVLKSVHNMVQVLDARDKGYATYLTVKNLRTDQRKQAFSLGSDRQGQPIKAVPCPYQTVKKTCIECRLCLDDQKLFRQGIVILAEVHGLVAKHNTDKVTPHSGDDLYRRYNEEP